MLHITVFTQGMQQPILPPMNIILFHQWPEHNSIPVSDYRGAHIKKVLRLVPGDSMYIGIVNGEWGIATIQSLEDSLISFTYKKQGDAQPLHPVTLLVAQVRPICMKRILREAASFGVERLLIVGADSAERSYASAKLWSTGEYQSYLLDGVMQSGQTSMPECLMVNSLDDALSREFSWESRLLLDNVMQGNPLSQISEISRPACIAIGPERGWSNRERRLFLDYGFAPCTMGKRVLRTETACSAAVAMVLGKLGAV